VDSSACLLILAIRALIASSLRANDDDGVVLAHFDALGLAQLGQSGFFQRQTDFLGDDGCRQSG